MLSIYDVLVVDDDESLRDSIHAYLETAGLTTCRAEDGEHALRLLRHVRPRVILLDMKMPGMDGEQTLQALRSDPYLADIPVVQISGSVPRGSPGIAGYLRKPFHPEDMLNTLKSLLPDIPVSA
jgi:CheY-like chemotaxis protein